MNKLKKFFAGAMVATLMLSTIGCSMIEKTQDGINNTVVAKVYGEKITLGQVDENLGSVTNQLVQYYGDNYKENQDAVDYLVEQRTNVLNTLINDVIFKKKAEEFKIMPTEEELTEKANAKLAEVKTSFKDDEGYQAALKAAGITEEQLLSELRLSAVSETVYDYVVKDVTVGEDEINEYYTNNQASFTEKPNKTDVSHILVDTEEEAKEVIQRLDNGEDFATIAKEVSTDTGTASKGGELGWIEYTSTQYDKTFLMAAIALKKGQYSAAPVHTQFGYHIIKCNDKEEYPVKPLEDVKEDIKKTLLEQNKYNTWSETVQKWQEESKYKTYEDRLSE